jgi:hypothetical protein
MKISFGSKDQSFKGESADYQRLRVCSQARVTLYGSNIIVALKLLAEFLRKPLKRGKKSKIIVKIQATKR